MQNTQEQVLTASSQMTVNIQTEATQSRQLKTCMLAQAVSTYPGFREAAVTGILAEENCPGTNSC